MIVLDENIDEPQRRRLEMWRIRVKQIGVDVGRLGMKDLNEIIPLLHGLRRSTLFTRDRDFYDPDLAHRNYCLVYLDIEPTETAQFVRAFLAPRVSHTSGAARQSSSRSSNWNYLLASWSQEADESALVKFERLLNLSVTPRGRTSENV